LIFVEGFVPNSNISPVEPNIGGGTNVGFTGAPVTALSAEGGAVLYRSFDGQSGEDDFAGFQCGLDGTIQPGGLYRVWLRARETGNSALASWNPHPVSMLLVDNNGKEYGIGLSPNYGFFWGPSASKNLTGTLDWFSVTLQMPSNTEGEMTPNSVGIWTYPLEAGGFTATRTLEIDALAVEEISGS